MCDPEIERTLRHIRKKARETKDNLKSKNTMGDQENQGNQDRSLKEFASPTTHSSQSSILKPNVATNNFELKPSLLSMVQQNQFGGTPTEDPNLHISIFLEYCDTLKMNGVSDDVIKLRLFPFSLRDKARAWLQSLPPGSITSWDQLSEAFLAKYFPPRKTAQLRNQITTFTQKEGESLYDAWERYKDLLRMCPHHGLEDWHIIHTFYNGLLYNTRMTVDATAGGSLMNKSVRDAKQVIEDMAQNHFQWSGERSLPKKSGRYDVDALDHIASRVDALFQNFDKMSMNSVASNSTNCEICGIIGHSAVECQNGNSPSPDAPLSEHNKQNEEFRNQNRIMSDVIKNLTSKVDSLATHNKMLENQITQLAQQFNSSSRSLGMFPGQPETNPKGSINAITLRSGKELEGPMMRNDHTDVVDESEKLVSSEKEHSSEKVERYVAPAPYKPPLPFPQRNLKKLHINILFVEAISQMPSYAKFLKEILSNKRRLEEYETVALTKECSDIIQNKLPPKLKDPGSFSIPCTIGDMSINHALCDLCATVRLMPLSICILEDVPIQVGKFYIRVDFVILEIEEDSQIPIILGRSFLATAGVIIDVKNGKLSLNIGDEKVNFDLFSTMKFPLIDDTCCRIDTIDMVVREDFIRNISSDPLEKCLVKNGVPDDDDQEITSYITILDESPNYTKTTYSKEPDIVVKITRGLNDQVVYINKAMSKSSRNSPD
ncbi:uncharacterized protein LOC109823298 [Asparagus officinalis]|uniref:uncharacterized protein LOC109823298 n=1 Tax=Asparagus officinalis TaxID=4686 RepID=UPI00098E0202|nr:uncharacterized protein LOC109823298 [Asparagus officinalis]